MGSSFPIELTCDRMLGGRVTLWQPASGYRAGSDPVLLAASVAARPGETILDLGCGAGAAFLCLAARVPDLLVAGLERQPAYAALARRNADENGVAAEIVEGDVAAMPASLRQRSFNHVLANPPWFAEGEGTAAADPGREGGRREAVDLARWIGAGARRLAPGGSLTVIQRAVRLPDILAALPAGLGDVTVLPLAARAGRAADRVIVRARKGSRAPFRLAAPLVLHDGAAHLEDRESYAAAARAVLWDAQPLII